MTSLQRARTATDLIPGDPDAMWADSDSLSVRSADLADLSTQIDRLETSQWTGVAANGFAEVRAALKAKVSIAVSCFDEASAALREHAAVLAWAQREAAGALRDFRDAAACVPPTSNGVFTVPGTPVGQSIALERVETLQDVVRRSARDTATRLNTVAQYGPMDDGVGTMFRAVLGLNRDGNPWHGATLADGMVGAMAAVIVPMPVGAGAARGGAAAQLVSTEAITVRRATLGSSTSTNYRNTFFKVYPQLRGKVWVHHAVEQAVLKEYPGLVTRSQINSFENLRGIPNQVNSDLHLSQIRKEWNRFYKAHPAGSGVTVDDFLDFATTLDTKLGSQFQPPIGPGGP